MGGLAAEEYLNNYPRDVYEILGSAHGTYLPTWKCAWQRFGLRSHMRFQFFGTVLAEMAEDYA